MAALADPAVDTTIASAPAAIDARMTCLRSRVYPVGGVGRIRSSRSEGRVKCDCKHWYTGMPIYLGGHMRKTPERLSNLAHMDRLTRC